MPGQTWKIDISKDRTSGRWVVGKPKGRPFRGVDFVEWTLNPDPDGHDVSAEFQFAHMNLFAGGDLTKDKTARIPNANSKLTLAVHPDADRRTNPHRYAVWIRDAKRTDGGEFAVGEDQNPPPEVNVGP